MSMRSLPALLGACALPVLLAACASRPGTASLQAAPTPAAPVPVSGKQPNRFEMTRNGERMTADDFDAWMRARGIRIAGGKADAGKADASKAKPAARPAKPAAGASGQRSAAKR